MESDDVVLETYTPDHEDYPRVQIVGTVTSFPRRESGRREGEVHSLFVPRSTTDDVVGRRVSTDL